MCHSNIVLVVHNSMMEWWVIKNGLYDILQSILHAAAGHVLCPWLHFKVAGLVHKEFHGLALSYLADLSIPLVPLMLNPKDKLRNSFLCPIVYLNVP